MGTVRLDSRYAAVAYRANPVHRDGTWGKSQWQISHDDEIECFDGARARRWFVGEVGWGLHLPGGRPDYVGVAQDHETKVFVAKFTEDQDVWHGYPADHRRNHQDIPTEYVLGDWMRARLLTPAKIRKLVRGQPCRL